MSEPVFQSSLGKKVDNSIQSQRSWSMGFLAFGRVMKVHHKRMTADVQLMDTNETIMSSPENEGRYSCKIGVSSAGYDEDIGLPYGVIRPLHVGEVVLVAFLRQNKNTPVILSSFHLSEDEVGESSYSNILSSIYPLTATQDMNRYVNISRIQDFLTIDGVGNTELASHTKSFLIATHENLSDDYKQFDYQDLHVKDKTSGNTVIPPKAYWSPLNLLTVFRDKFEDEVTSWLKIFINAGKTMFRLTKMQVDNKLTSIELSELGDVIIRRQLDSNSLNQGELYTECKLGQDGFVDITIKGEEDNITTINLTSSTISISTKTQIKMESKNDITIKSDKTLNVSTKGTAYVTSNEDMYVNSDGTLYVNSDNNLQVSSKGNVNFSCINGYINGKRIIVKGDRDSRGDVCL